MGGSSNQVLDLHTYRQALQNLRYSGSSRLSTMELVQPLSNHPDLITLLGNVCNAHGYTKQLLATSLLSSSTTMKNNSMMGGRVILETRPDVAPKMAKNFGSLCTGEKGLGYKGCQVFQCWGGESCIAGDFECNSG